MNPEELIEKLRSYDQADEMTWLEDEEMYGFDVEKQDMYSNFEGCAVAFFGRDIVDDWKSEYNHLESILEQTDYYSYYGRNLVVYVTEEPVDIEDLEPIFD